MTSLFKTNETLVYRNLIIALGFLAFYVLLPDDIRSEIESPLFDTAVFIAFSLLILSNFISNLIYRYHLLAAEEGSLMSQNRYRIIFSIVFSLSTLAAWIIIINILVLREVGVVYYAVFSILLSFEGVVLLWMSDDDVDKSEG